MEKNYILRSEGQSMVMSTCSIYTCLHYALYWSVHLQICILQLCIGCPILVGQLYRLAHGDTLAQRVPSGEVKLESHHKTCSDYPVLRPLGCEMTLSHLVQKSTMASICLPVICRYDHFKLDLDRNQGRYIPSFYTDDDGYISAF